MGYYIQTDANFGKAQYIADHHKGILLDHPPAWASIPAGYALIVVVNNGPFEAAGYAFSQSEYEAFLEPDDRPRQYVLIPEAIAHKLTGYKP